MMNPRFMASTAALAVTGIASARAFAVTPASTNSVQRLSQTLRHNSPTKRTFLNMFGGSDEFSTQEEITKALEDENATILDVRGPDEIAATGHWKTDAAWTHLPCSPSDASLLAATAPSLLRTPSSPVIVHCASGKRAAKAKETLEQLGYENVLNAGGWKQVEEYRNNQK